ncbi:penicillin-binding protein activator [Wenzhouxiangella sp. EGI_FJ10305]|uniref:penicillin-binding protein activator n=1 Tax=Wenzhouxiangella sp. EGI_FJ10305 TaxID=3243768 RepID=UPI0035D67C47
MKRLILILAALVLLAACAPSGPGVRSGDGDDAEIGRIEQMLAAGDYEDAALAFEQEALDRPQVAGSLLIRAAEAWLRAERAGEAEQALGRIDVSTLSDHELLRLDLAQAELAMLRGDLANAGWLLASTADQLPDDLEARHAELEARLLELESAPVRGALDALEQAVAEPDFSGETALALMLEFPLTQVERVLYQVGDRPELLPWLDLVISARENLLDDPALDEALTAWERRWPDLEYSADEARRWIAAWRQTRPLPAHITVLLPAKGTSLHRPGEALREGLVAGWLRLPPDHRPRLTFRYIGSEPEAVVSAWFDARENGTDFLIGPLDRGKAQALADLPDAGVIPTLLLNLPEDVDRLAEAGGEIAALALPPETEAELAAIHALATGRRRALVIAQYSEWGERVAEAFTETFMLGGGQVLANRIYDPELPDHSALLRDMLEVDRSEDRIDRLSGLLDGEVESVAQRRTDADVIFLGARAADGRLLRPQLAFFDAGDLALMATSYIVDGAPQTGRDRDLDGISTPMPPWFLDFTTAGTLRERARSLYAGLDNATLSRLHALGRDAIALVPWLSMMRADPTLSLPGMMGELSLPEGNIIRRDLPVIRIEGGVASPVELRNEPAASR